MVDLMWNGLMSTLDNPLVTVYFKQFCRWASSECKISHCTVSYSDN